MLRTVLIVGSGGFIGSVMRYMVQHIMEKVLISTFPWGTLIANVTGSLIIGMVFGLAGRGNVMNAEWRIFLAVGICGGFTTFSSFAYNSFSMLSERDWRALLLNTGGNFFLSLIAVYLGVVLIRLIF
ncbi:MAG: fluoride efflux transporter CrcB [Mariniphaga sp.]|nr:fluoride efflux transporter CrcB [Mariniphaga sp.]MDD4225526.1 fluoride efflux transporter CrcB [Mariniphaga sp.]